MSRNGGKFGKKTEENKVRIEDAIASNAWCTRRVGYEAATADFKKPDLRGKNWDLFTELVKTLTAERNIPALEKGLESVLAFVENCSIVDDDVVKIALNNVVKKGLSDVKPRIRELANRICMALYDRKKHEMVTDMLLQGMEARNSKHAFSCIRTLTNALTDYGPSYVNIPAVATKAVALCQDKAMFQQDVKDLLREMYKWNGPDVIERYMRSLDASQQKAMEIEFAKMDHDRNDRSTFLHKPPMSVDSYMSRSSVDSKPKSARPTVTLPQKSVKNNRPSSTSQVLKSGRLSSPTSRLVRTANTSSKKLPDRGCGDRLNRRNQPSVATKMELDDIFIMMENKNWGERKEAVEALYNRIYSNTTINAFDYAKMIKRLRVLILEDTNVVLVSKAIKCVTALAKSQNKEFQQHVPLMTTLLLEKFKDKKGIIIDAIREAIDAMYSGFQFGSIVRYVTLSLMSTNPSVKAETAFFVQRCFTKPTPALLKVNHWQPLVHGLVNNLTFPDQNVRENAMQALGTILKAVGNESLAPYVDKIPKHQLSSILKYSNNAEVVFMSSSSCARTEKSVDVDSDSEDLVSRSTADSKFISTKINSLLPGFKAQAGPQSVYSLDDSDSSAEKETNHRNSRYIHANQRNPSNTSFSTATMSSRPNSSRKSLSPAARQKLATFKCVIKQLKEAWRNVQDQPQNIQPSLVDQPQEVQQGISSLGSIEEKITRKLQDLEGNVSKCFMEIRHLSPQLYEELEYSGNQTRDDVIRTLNQRLYDMERLLKSMAFEICPMNTSVV